MAKYIDQFNIPETEKYPKRHIIRRRRRQILVHSHLYYDKDESLISDADFDKWCMELVELQKRYPKAAENVEYHKEFKDFDGSTGIGLPYRTPNIMKLAERLLKNEIQQTRNKV